MDVLMEGKDLRKLYRTGEVEIEVLKGINFQIFYGEFIVVLGQSGSGKTTLLNIIGGMTQATTGELYYKGQPLHEIDDQELTFYRRNEVGFVFQNYNLMPNLTTYENVRLAVEIAQNPLSVSDILREVGLDAWADHFPSQLSGGQQQRVAIARAIVKNPELLLCDEPTGALDIQTGIQVLKALQKLNREYHKTVMIITHNVEIAKMANRVFYLKDGLLEDVKVNEHPLCPEDISW
ncbi:ABC transporter ATP-binding protein [Desulfosporosinus sp. BICA1-9]|uniref:ABC transporter ATP-binding protein n=1 Tax=Desulfosporosinus sp. BICA1-9 TaxID=1531958 RepID=UPI00054BF669|nr:ABC transporter ATP-binding protein [Desulfosporosinus sp. BICA1-9]KJS48303.1 MAG: macrolide ABC transporter ATP-binding protein [Peptococcaceae bacterium BRH_c23]KJS84916.1 MAG: macrolide ABC transporter ATP-binding protein [Desulfosporosinus sp. BICA1-9]HBW38987.1 ABC transporter ATP-binding protein [Desulfosporosinus sp.]